jgi:hypothetical protein
MPMRSVAPKPKGLCPLVPMHPARRSIAAGPMAARRRNEPIADDAGQQRAGGISRLPLWALQPHARSAVVRVNEDNAGRFEGALNRIDEVCPSPRPRARTASP